ncbi:MAG: helix-turn-helix domain-containing protein [Methanosarcinaceae archaeon]
MTKTEMYPIKRKLSLEDLNKRIRYIEALIKIHNRLYFIKYRYMGASVEEASKKVGVTKRIGYIWQKRWNKDGYTGLFPRYGQGRPSKLSDKQKSDLQTIITENKKNNLTPTDVRDLIKERFDVEYSLKQVKVIINELS